VQTAEKRFCSECGTKMIKTARKKTIQFAPHDRSKGKAVLYIVKVQLTEERRRIVDCRRI
jgi:hypothetical protein